jgi:hypothetical protein
MLRYTYTVMLHLSVAADRTHQQPQTVIQVYTQLPRFWTKTKALLAYSKIFYACLCSVLFLLRQLYKTLHGLTKILVAES